MCLNYTYRPPQFVPVHLHLMCISDFCAQQLFYAQNLVMLNNFIQQIAHYIFNIHFIYNTATKNLHHAYINLAYEPQN